jgi:hypothetical protein
MRRFLIGFTYHEPESRALWEKGIIEDYESSTAIFISAASAPEAIRWAETIATELHKRVNGDATLDWKCEYSCWHVEDPKSSPWNHCLEFFQTVNFGERPAYEQMGTKAYTVWMEANNINF